MSSRPGRATEGDPVSKAKITTHTHLGTLNDYKGAATMESRMGATALDDSDPGLPWVSFIFRVAYN